MNVPGLTVPLGVNTTVVATLWFTHAKYSNYKNVIVIKFIIVNYYHEITLRIAIKFPNSKLTLRYSKLEAKV